jgi:hypothetical protein
MPCQYRGSRRVYGLRGVVIAKTNGTITVKWDNTCEEQKYNTNGYMPYVFNNVEFYLQYQQPKKESPMNTVTLLTVANSVTLEVTPAQASIFENTDAGRALVTNGTVRITKAMKQDGQYFALQPLNVTPTLPTLPTLPRNL